MADSERLLELAGQVRSELEESSKDERRLLAASHLLSQLLLQDVERKEGKVQIQQGTSAERIPSVHDPEIRHGRESASKRFDGHWVGVAVDTDEQLITAVDVMAGSARDADDALKLVEESEAATGVEVEMALGDAAYGSAETRRKFLDANRTLVAKVPGTRENAPYFTRTSSRSIWRPSPAPVQRARSPAEWFAKVREPLGGEPDRRRWPSPLTPRPACNARCAASATAPKTRGGRTVLLHPEEELLAQARAIQRSSAFEAFRRRRQVAEHRIARLVQLGLRQARYRGRTKTLFQALMAAAVANLTLVAGKSDLMGPQGAPQRLTTALTNALQSLRRAFQRPHPSDCRPAQRPRPNSIDRPCRPFMPSSTPAFRPGF